MLLKPSQYTEDRLRGVEETLNRASLILEKISVEHKVLSDDQSSLSKKVGDNERDLRLMQNQISKSDGFVDTAKYFGITLIVILAGGWTSINTKLDTNTAKTDNNSQSIEQIKKDADDTQKQVNEITAKVASNREAILSAVHDAKRNGDLK